MSREISVRSSITIRSGNLVYQSPGKSLFTSDLNANKGPCPGMVTIPVGGISITFPYLTTPGQVVICNLDTANFVEYGIKDPGSGKFYPLGEVLAGESYVFRFSRNLLENYTNTGTGTTGDVNYLWLKADTAPCDVIIDAFEGASA